MQVQGVPSGCPAQVPAPTAHVAAASAGDGARTEVTSGSRTAAPSPTRRIASRRARPASGLGAAERSRGGGLRPAARAPSRPGPRPPGRHGASGGRRGRQTSCRPSAWRNTTAAVPVEAVRLVPLLVVDDDLVGQVPHHEPALACDGFITSPSPPSSDGRTAPAPPSTRGAGPPVPAPRPARPSSTAARFDRSLQRRQRGLRPQTGGHRVREHLEHGLPRSSGAAGRQ